MTVHATFRGGPIGGTVQMLDTLLPTYRVPIMRRTNCVVQDGPLPNTPFQGYDVAEYREAPWERSYRTTGGVWETVYEWVDPSDAIRSEAKRWKDRALAAEKKLEQDGKLREAFLVIKELVA